MSESKNPEAPEATPSADFDPLVSAMRAAARFGATRGEMSPTNFDRAPELDKLEGFVYVPEAYQPRTKDVKPDSLAKAFKWVEDSRGDLHKWSVLLGRSTDE